MTQTSETSARDFVAKLQLPSPPARRRGPARAIAPFDFEDAKEQAMVVGSDIVSFVKAVTPQQRKDIVNALLLAQFVAKNEVREPRTLAELAAWYERYFDVLSNIGFVIQQTDFREYHDAAKGFKAHEAILEVAGTLLAGAPTALAVLTSTLQALQRAGDNQPWITLFDQESRSANAARFQVSTVAGDESGAVIFLNAFGLEATADLTQVLFFRFHSNEVKIQYNEGKATIVAQVLGAVREPIAEKIAAHANRYIAGLPVLKQGDRDAV
jgi:hypothetical protein